MSTRAWVTGIALYTATPTEVQEMVAAIIKGLASGVVNPKIGHVYKLPQASQSHIDIISGSGAQGKLVLRPWEL